MTDHDHTAPLPDVVLRVKALESLLVERGIVDPAALDVLIDLYENQIGPKKPAQRLTVQLNFASLPILANSLR